MSLKDIAYKKVSQTELEALRAEIEWLKAEDKISHTLLTHAKVEIERLRATLELLATGEPAAAGFAKSMSFKEWVRIIARCALEGKRADL
jgi:hypothetical protein